MLLKSILPSFGPTISVIIAAYNLAHYLPACLDSVLAQTFQAFELIVVDDGSIDSTPDVAAEYQRRDRRVRSVHHANHGLPYTRNAGLWAAAPSSAFVLFVDADDVLLPGALEVMQTALWQQPDALACVSRFEHLDAEGRPQDGWRPQHAPGWHGWADLVDGRGEEGVGIYPASVILYRRSWLELVGGYNVFMRGAEDEDLNERLLVLGRFWFIPDVLTGYRRHGGNVTNNDAFCTRWHREAMRRRCIWQQVKERTV